MALVGHGGESNYLRRLRNKLLESLRQLPAGDECWVAIHWSNGAPIDVLAASIPWDELPSRVVGVVVVGAAVAFPHPQIHQFVNYIPRGLEPGIRREIQTEDDQRFIENVYDRFQPCSGIRPTLIRGREPSGASRVVLHRDGSRRILPFNLLLDLDPPGFRAAYERVMSEFVIDAHADPPQWRRDPLLATLEE